MQNIECIHHLVHIGFDKDTQLDLSGAIKTRIEEISDRVGYILNFVDEPLFSKIEAEKVQIIKLADTLMAFIEFNNLKSMKIGNILDDSIKGYPDKVINYLYTLLDGKWQKIREGSLLEKKYRKENVYSLDFPTEVQKDIIKSEITYKNIMGDDFLDILLKMIYYFYNQNIYNIKISDNIENINCKNKDRRLELMEYAKKMLGESRIIVSGMGDGDVNRLITDYHELKKGLNLEVWEEEYGNASDYILDINAEVFKMKFIRFHKLFYENIKLNGLVLKDTTKHILGGEYINRCVNSYGHILSLYGFSNSNIVVDASISLVSVYDKGFS